jgi:hypothetical protein
LYEDGDPFRAIYRIFRPLPLFCGMGFFGVRKTSSSAKPPRERMH